jgi:hypothetical protein
MDASQAGGMGFTLAHVAIRFAYPGMTLSPHAGGRSLELTFEPSPSRALEREIAATRRQRGLANFVAADPFAFRQLSPRGFKPLPRADRWRIPWRRALEFFSPIAF